MGRYIYSRQWNQELSKAQFSICENTISLKSLLGNWGRYRRWGTNQNTVINNDGQSFLLSFQYSSMRSSRADERILNLLELTSIHSRTKSSMLTLRHNFKWYNTKMLLRLKVPCKFCKLNRTEKSKGICTQKRTFIWTQMMNKLLWWILVVPLKYSVQFVGVQTQFHCRKIEYRAVLGNYGSLDPFGCRRSWMTFQEVSRFQSMLGKEWSILNLIQDWSVLISSCDF